MRLIESKTGNEPKRNFEPVGRFTWSDDDINVFATRDTFENEDGTQFEVDHLNIHCVGLKRRPNTTEVKRAMKAFSVVGAVEFNTSPGVNRNFYRRVDLGSFDLTKDGDQVIAEADGYVWHCAPGKIEEIRSKAASQNKLNGASF